MGWKPLIRHLLYPVQFEQDPLAGVERVIEQIRGDNPERYLAAIEAALRSEEPTGKLTNMSHPEAVVRRFLEAVAERIRVDLV